MRVYAFFYNNTLNPFNSNPLSAANAIYYKLYKAFTVYALSVVNFSRAFLLQWEKAPLSTQI